MKKQLIFDFKILFSIILIIILLSQINFYDLVNLLLTVKIKIYLITFFITIAGIFLSSYKWHLLLKSQKIQIFFKKLNQLYFIGFFFNNFLPTSIGGDAVRGYYLSKNLNIKLSVSLASITVERIVGVAVLFFFILIGAFLNWELVKKLNIAYILYLVILAFLVLSAFLFNGKLKKIINFGFNFKILNRLFGRLKNLYEAVNIYRREKKVIFQSLALSFIFQGMIVINSYLYILAIGNHISMLKLIFIIPLISLISLIPVSVNGIGVTEGAFVYFFTQIGLSPIEALSIALLSRGVKLGVSLIGGIIYSFSNKICKNEN